MLSGLPKVIQLANGRTNSNPGRLIAEAVLWIAAVQGPTNDIPPSVTVGVQAKNGFTIFKGLGENEEEYFVTYFDKKFKFQRL